MFTRAGATLGRVAATRAAAQTSVVARRAAVPVTRRAALSTEAAAADAGAASKGSIWDKLPRDPNYEGFMGVAKYYFPTNDKFVIFVVSNYAAVIGFFMWKSKRAEAAEAARAPPPSYPDFAKELAKLNA